MAHAVLGTDVRGHQWGDTTAQAILTGGAEAALSALSVLTPCGETQCAQLRRAIEYFTTNADRMHYAAYLAQALPLGSGVVESACRLVCGLRCKGPGMRWSLSGVQSVLSLRAERLSQPAR